MNNFKKWQNELTAKRMIEILEKNGYNTLYADNIAVARQQVLNLLPENATIGLGGSVTLEEMEILEKLRSKKYRLIERYKCPVNEHVKVYREALIADFFLTSVNAATELGELVVTDCSGNRAAALIFGPERVIVADCNSG